MPKKIVITVFGSLGDLHPMLALGIGLKARGHDVVIATNKLYQSKIEGEGLTFKSLGPDMAVEDPAIYEYVMDRKFGPERLMKEFVFPFIQETYDGLRPLLEDTDFLVNHTLVYPGPVIAEHLKLPWASVTLAPFSYISAYDPPVFPLFLFTEKMRNWPLWFWKFFMRFMSSYSDSWAKPVYELQEQLGVPKRGNPIFEGQFSPYVDLALFSEALVSYQPDWPTKTKICGFCFYDKEQHNSVIDKQLEAFLAAGEPPVVFTLGSAAVNAPGRFYHETALALQKLDCRAVILKGSLRTDLPDFPKDDRFFVTSYAPYSQLFPKAKVVVHQGGVGTTAQVMRAGVPTIVVPYGFDQPDNAARMKRLGVGRAIQREKYNASRLLESLSLIFQNRVYAQNAKVVAAKIAQEDGVATACKAIEAFL